MGKRTQHDEFSSDEDELPQEKLAWTQEDDDDATTASAHSSAPSKGSKGAKGKGKGGKGKGKGKGKGRVADLGEMSDDDDELVESGKRPKNAKKSSKAASWAASSTPESADATTIFVKNLAKITHDDDLAELFKDIGVVRNAFVVLDETKKSRGFAYVTFSRQEDVDAAIKEYNGYELQGSKLELSKAKPRRVLGKNGADVPRDFDEFKESLSAVLSNVPVSYRSEMTALRSWLDRVMPSNGMRKLLEETSNAGDENAKTIQVRLVFSKPQQVARAIAVLNHAPLGTKKNAAPERLRCEVKAVALQGQSSRNGRVMFRNVSFGVDEALLREKCEPLGKVKEVAMPLKPSGERRGFAFVQFEERSAAEKAVSQLHGLKLKGRMIAVDFAVDKRLYDNLRSLGPPPEGAVVTETPLPLTANSSLGYAGDENEEENDANDEIQIEKSEKKGKKDKNVIESIDMDGDEDMKDNQSADEDEEGDEEDKNENDEDEEEDEGEDEKEEDEEDESDEELIDEETGKTLRKPGFDVDENKTLFMRNVSYEATEEDVQEALSKFGKIAYVKLVKNPMDPKNHKGTAFVKFHDGAAAAMVLAEEERANKKINELVTASARRGKTTEKVAFEGLGVSVKGRRVHIFPATTPKEAKDSQYAPGMDKNDSKKEKQEAKHKERTKWFHLLHEGQIGENHPNYKNMSQKEWDMRETSKKERKWRANNPNFVINPLRLSIRGLPWDVDRAVLSNHIRQFVMKECNLDKAGVRKIIDQVIVVKQKKDAYAQSGEQRRSAGYGFASFHDHEIAKKVLKYFNGNDNPGWKKQGNNGLRPIVEFTLDDKRKLRQQEDAKAKLKSALDRQAKEKGFKSAEEMLGKEQLDKATALKKSKSQRKKEKKLSRGQKQREKRRQQKAAAEAEAKEAEAALANKKSKKVKKIVAKNAETPQVKKDATKLALEGKKNKTAKEKLLLQKLNVLAGDAAALNKMTKISEKKDVAKKKQPMATAKAAKNAKSDKKAIKEQEQKRKLQQEFAEIGAPTGDHIPRKKRKAMLEEARKSKKMKMASIEDFEANRFASYN